jgi:hypothetical protein
MTSNVNNSSNRNSSRNNDLWNSVNPIQILVNLKRTPSNSQISLSSRGNHLQ